MAKTKTPAPIVPAAEIIAQSETVVVWRTTRPMTRREYDELSARLRAEGQSAGIKIILAPSIVDGAEIVGW